jgi:hypothetical protein
MKQHRGRAPFVPRPSECQDSNPSAMCFHVDRSSWFVFLALGLRLKLANRAIAALNASPLLSKTKNSMRELVSPTGAGATKCNPAVSLPCLLSLLLSRVCVLCARPPKKLFSLCNFLYRSF